MKAPIAILLLIGVFFLVMGLYMNIEGVVYAGNMDSRIKWQRPTLSGNFLLLLSIATFICVLYLIRRDRK